MEENLQNETGHPVDDITKTNVEADQERQKDFEDTKLDEEEVDSVLGVGDEMRKEVEGEDYSPEEPRMAEEYDPQKEMDKTVENILNF